MLRLVLLQMFSATRARRALGVACASVLLVVPLAASTPHAGAAATLGACTLYVSPGGSATAPGTSSSPVSLDAALSKVSAGSVVCLGAGTYNRSKPLYLNRSGTASGWIVYRSYNGQPLLNWSGGASDVVQVTNGTRYVEVNGLKIDGRNVSTNGLKCGSGAHHIRFIGNVLVNNGASGVATVGCDYVNVEQNQILHTGYGAGWGSGISLNSHVWADQGAGFHSVVANNFVAGTFDGSTNHSDGNGIVLDRGTNTPPVLVINNVVYENGARCVVLKEQTHSWIVNNTCYGHGIDLYRSSYAGSIVVQDSSDAHVINNIAYAWTNRPTYDQLGSNASSASGVSYRRNIGYGGSGPRWVPSSITGDSNQYRLADPKLSGAPSLSSSGGGQYANAPAPWSIGGAFSLQSTSPAINIGIDPRSAPGITTALSNGMAAYVTRDITGAARPQGSGWDAGAYESSSSGTPPPSSSAATITIYAAGTQAGGVYPTMQLQLNGTSVASFSNVVGDQKAYTYRAGRTVRPSEVRVAFTNNGTDSSGNDRNLRVNRINIDGANYESEASTTYSTGTWTAATSCNAGYKRSEWLQCNGYFQYG